jgi:hypothetical protein
MRTTNVTPAPRALVRAELRAESPRGFHDWIVRSSESEQNRGFGERAQDGHDSRNGEIVDFVRRWRGDGAPDFVEALTAADPEDRRQREGHASLDRFASPEGERGQTEIGDVVRPFGSILQQVRRQRRMAVNHFSNTQHESAERDKP